MQVMSKEQEIAQFRINEIQAQQRHQGQIDEITQNKKERESLIGKLEKQIKDRDYEVEKLVGTNRRLEDEVKHMIDKINNQEKSYQVEYDRKFEELKQLYSEQIDKQKKLFQASHTNHSDQDVMDQLKDEIRKLAHEKIINEEAIQRLES